jgi:hypothetical protein
MVQHGWKAKPSPRRGFTVVEASRELAEAPVVMAVHDSTQGIHLFRAALDEAISRSTDLVVLDYGATSLHDEIEDESREIDPRARSDMRALWTNPHVRVERLDPVEASLERTVSYCESNEASMLIIGAAEMSRSPLEKDLAKRMFHGEFDVLVVTDHLTEDPRGG